MSDIQKAIAELGMRIRKVRVRKGLSQKALANKSGVIQSHISMIERGEINPSIKSYIRLTNALNMEIRITNKLLRKDK